MLARLPANSVIRETLADASAILQFPLSQLDTKGAMDDMESVQLSIFIASIASARMLSALGLPVSLLAGHSLGTFSAATFAGVMSFADGLRVVRTRARAMKAAYPAGYGMAVITGLSHRVCIELISRVRAEDAEVYIAGFNSPEETTIAGSNAGLTHALDLANRAGARRASFLRVTVPSHTPLMRLVREQILEEIRGILPRPASIRCVSNRIPRILVDETAILDDLVCSIDEPVRWQDATELLYESGVRSFVEMHPGTVLTGLTHNLFPDSRCAAVDGVSLDSLPSLVGALLEFNE